MGGGLLLLALAACSPHPAPSPAPQPAAPAGAPASTQAPATSPPAPVPPAEATVPPLRLSGQKVLVLPVQAAPGMPFGSEEQATSELVFALGERDPRASWIFPDALRRALRSAPGFASDPGNLPADPLVHHREHVAVDPLIGELRRFGALTDARLVLLPRFAAWIRDPSGGGRVRFSAALIDSRNGDVIWWGEADGDLRPTADTQALASAASAITSRMVAAVAPP